MSVNDFVQWAAIVCLSVFILGLYRQLAELLGSPKAGSLEATSGPPMHRKLAAPLLAALRSVPPSAGGEVTIAFVSEGCAGCGRLLAELADSATQNLDGVVVIARSRTSMYREALKELRVPVVHDDDGTLWSSANISITPFLLGVNGKGIVEWKAVDHHVRRSSRQGARTSSTANGSQAHSS